MFTVLHRGPDGSETYYEAETVSRFARPGEEATPALGEVRLGGVTLESVPGTNVGLAIEGPFGAVFVMNARGTTIARY